MKHDRIVVDPQVMVGKPVIKGTRIPVEQILRGLSEGLGVEALMDAYPRLTAADIYAAIAYAADIVANEDIYLSEPNNAVSG